MKRILLLACFIIYTLQATAQKMPKIKVGDENLGITSLEINIDVIGNIATTTYDMLFYNPTSETLEGELSFPLGESQNVSRLALDVNGKLREAVVVEKELGRVAFEAVVRRGVDPILLEKGTGNNYKARIYPIFPNSHKRVVLAYEQELIQSEGNHFFQLPLDFKKNLDNFSINMNVFDQKLKPELTKGFLENFSFKNIAQTYSASFSKKNFTPTQSLTIKIPQASDHTKLITDQDYFYSFISLEGKAIERKKPKTIALFWDVSLSMKDRLIDNETEVLNRYFNHLKNVEVKLVKFSNTVVSEAIYTIVDGNWQELKTTMIESIYDGGTSFKALQSSIDADEVLIFSDGMKNLSNLDIDFNTQIFVINSLIKANHNELKSICEAHNGKYLNLMSKSPEEVFKQLTTKSLKFLGYSSNNDNLELYPKKNVTVTSDFSVAGKGFTKGDSIKLKFGYNNRVTQKHSFIIEGDIENQLVKRFWAQKKLALLQEKSEENRSLIVQHAKKYQLVSDHTSLIVLESVWDYVKYEITPPEELLVEYNKIMAKQKGEKVSVVSEEAISEEQETNESSGQSTSTEVVGNIENGNISGVVSDATGPLPGVNVVVKGTSQGTQTDFDGKYTINASSGDVLTFSFVGFQTLETTIGGSSQININMEEDSSELQEVVVTAQGIKRERKALGFAVSEVKNDQIEQRTEGDVARVLSGKASGVQITSQSGVSGSATNVVIRGYNSINGNNQVLFIVDGVPFSSDTNTPQDTFATGNNGTSRFLDLDPNNIESINVLKGIAAATLYGTAGRNGVIVITTKGGSQSISSPSSRGGTTRQSSNPFIKYKKYTVDDDKVNTEYLKELRKAKSVEEAYTMYLQQRDRYIDHPSYFIDVSDFFKKWKNQHFSARILSNIAEIDADNYELLRAFAYKLEERNNHILAAFIFEQIIKLRPEDAQSYRDLALTYKELNEFDKAIALLKSIVDESVYKNQGRRKFEGMQTIAKNEIKTLLNDKKFSSLKNSLKLKKRNTTYDVRVVIDWNHNDTDIDLHVIDPNYEICSYQNTKTRIGGRISSDMTEGFGPEEFTIKNATKGDYFVQVKYFGDRYQKIENPTFMKVTLFKNYGRPNESKEVKVVRLLERKDKKVVAKITI